jgi:hypothetical protein
LRLRRGEIKPNSAALASFEPIFTLHSRDSSLSHGAKAASSEVDHHPPARQDLLKMPTETVAAVPGATYTAVLNLHEAEAPRERHSSETDCATDLRS